MTRVVLIGKGACTPLGNNAPASAAAVRAGFAGLGEHPFMIGRDGQPMVVCRIPFFENAVGGSERLCDMTRLAVEETLQPLAVPPNLSIFLGLPEARPGIDRDLDVRITEALHSFLPSCEVEVVAFGHAAGLVALQKAYEAVLEDPRKVVLAGAVDSYLNAASLEWLDELEQLSSDHNLFGFPPGEGAGFCLLGSEEHARRLGLSYASVLGGVATAIEENRIKTETICVGRGLTEAFKQLLPLSDGQLVDDIICDLNGEPYRADEYGFTLARMGTHFRAPTDFQAPADCWGDVGAASGPLFVCLADQAARKGYAKGPHTFIWASSESGARSALLLHHPNLEKR